MEKLIKFQYKDFNDGIHYGIYNIENETITCLCCGCTVELENIILPFVDCGYPFPCLENAIKYYMDDEPE